MKAAALLLLASLGWGARVVEGPLRDAHNCYPYSGKWTDRVDRALGTGFPVAIEQDIAWGAGANAGRAVVSHTEKTTGAEPLLKDYFFEHVRPLVEQALRENRRETWPLIVVHFDFKDNRPELLREVWRVLGEYQGWIGTAEKLADPRVLAPIEKRPLLVLTEEPEAQEQVFFREVPVGGKLRLFGSVKPAVKPGPEATPEQLLPEGPTNYRRWWNNSWHLVEPEGQPEAGAWTEAKAARLKALVDRAHALGYAIRFYTLDGFSPEEGETNGWLAPYNFGSREAVRIRWKAALDAGVDLIATDQYEELARFAKERK